MSYKDTLNLPKTDFPMQANLQEKEPAKYKEWANVWENEKYNEHDDDEYFVLHDGPPYANGDIHVGHALNKILKDFLVKWHLFDGFNVEFRPGWDCHGLPIEKCVKEKLDSATDLRHACREYAQNWVDKQQQSFQNLGVWADWKHRYLTMEHQGLIYRGFLSLFYQNLISERQKPVYWSWAEQTALAEAEIEYRDRTDTAVYVAFNLQFPFQIESTFVHGLLVWTTTPWTLPANVAVAANPNAEYAVIATKQGNLLVSKACFPFNFEYEDTGLICKGSVLEGKLVSSPLNIGLRPIILDEFAQSDKGTGFVHIAPGHGEEDYHLGLKHNLPTVMPVDKFGRFTAEVAKLLQFPVYSGNLASESRRMTNGQHLVGIRWDKANELIIESLEATAKLVAKSNIVHSYPHCWRSNTPVIYRSTNQWFVDLKSVQAEKLLEPVEFVPENGKKRLLDMISGRPEWCISRQRAWGVPIALFRSKQTGQILKDKAVLDHIAHVFDMHGTDCWFTTCNEFFLPPHYHDIANDLEKVTDILDVWFDSGMSWATLDRPADVYLEGNDQYRGWFQSSFLLSALINGKAPYKKVITHGFIVDKDGNKMAKSQGNVISPDEIAKKYGIEVFRVWVAMNDYTKDLKLGDESLQRASDIYKKLRNTFRFLLANMSGFISTGYHYTKTLETDTWIINKAFVLLEEYQKLFEQGNFCTAMHLLIEFVTADLSAIFMNAAKDRLYCGTPTARKSAQKACYVCLYRLLEMLSPVITHTCDEVVQHMPESGRFDLFKDKNISEICKTTCKTGRTQPQESIVYGLQVLNAFNLSFDTLKKEEKIKDKMDVVVKGLKLPASEEFADLFGISDYVQESEGELFSTFQCGEQSFEIRRAMKPKCARCWKRVVDEGDLCPRCKIVVG